MSSISPNMIRFIHRASLIIVLVLAFIGTAFAADYTFTVVNKSNTTITKLFTSEDSRKWGFFDIGAGIKPGRQMELAWGAHTNTQECKQYIKAQYADGSESQPAIFDFCLSNLVIEFD